MSNTFKDFKDSSISINNKDIENVQKASFSKDLTYRAAYARDNETITPTKVFLDGIPRYNLSFTILDRTPYAFSSADFKEGLIAGNTDIISAKVSNGQASATIEKGIINSVSYQIGAEEFPTISYNILGFKGSEGGGGGGALSTIKMPFSNEEPKLPQKIKTSTFGEQVSIKSFSASFSREVFFINKSAELTPTAIFLSARDKIECSIETYSSAMFQKNSKHSFTIGGCSLKNLSFISSEPNGTINDINTTIYKFVGNSPDSALSV